MPACRRFSRVNSAVPKFSSSKTFPIRRAGAGQVRVRMHAVGVNPYDTYMRAGAYAIKPDLPYTPGADAAGVIDQVGAGVQGLEDRRSRLRQRHGARQSAWRLRAVRRLHAGAGAPAARSHFVHAGRGPVRALCHGVARAVRPRQHARRRHGADPRRQRRRWRCRHAVRGRGRRHGDRHGRHRTRALPS